MMFYINCLAITIICVIIIDIDKFVETFTSYLSYLLTKGKSKKPWDIKPINCSLCMSFWLMLFYMVFLNNFSILNSMFIVIMSFMSGLIYELILFIYDLLIKFINYGRRV